MAWQRRIPFGYRMEQGTLGCEPAEAETVRRVFSMYLAGDSMKRIAEVMTGQSVPYHKDKPCWNKNMVKRILENGKYLGDGEYPRIIRDEDFLAAQRLKESKNLYAPCPTKIVPLKNKLVCGVCGSGMTRLSVGNGAARWKCQNPACQSAVRFADSMLCERVDDCFRMIAQAPVLLADCDAPTVPTSSDVMRLENELVAAFNRGAESTEYMKTLIFAAAAEKYRQLPDHALQSKTKNLRERVNTRELTDQLKQELMDNVVQAIRIGPGSTVTMQLINGRSVESKEETQ
jgi:hypothetical protein